MSPPNSVPYSPPVVCFSCRGGSGCLVVLLLPPPRVFSHQTRSTKIIVFRSMRLSEILSPSFWSQIWIDYSRFDPAYADSRSAGYNVDVCNGHSTLPPTLFLMVSMVWPIFGAKVRLMLHCAFLESVPPAATFFKSMARLVSRPGRGVKAIAYC